MTQTISVFCLLLYAGHNKDTILQHWINGRCGVMGVIRDTDTSVTNGYAEEEAKKKQTADIEQTTSEKNLARKRDAADALRKVEGLDQISTSAHPCFLSDRQYLHIQTFI